MANKNDFAIFEDEYSLFDSTYNGKPYWQALRFRACEAAFGRNKPGNDKISNRNIVEIAIAGIKSLVLGIKGSIKARTIKPCDVVCFLDGGSAGVFYNNWDFPSGLKYESIRNSSTPANIPINDKHANLMTPYFIARMKYLFHSVSGKNKRDPHEFEHLIQIEKEMRKRFGSSLSAAQMEKRIFLNEQIYAETQKYYERLFERTHCKALVVVCYYQEMLYAAYAVARKMNIRIIELQHGIIFNHQSYAFHLSSEANNILAPDYFITFGQAHADGASLIPHTRALPLGFPFQEQQLEVLKHVVCDDKMIMVYPEKTPNSNS